MHKAGNNWRVPNVGARYLRDTTGGVIAGRRAPMSESRDDIRVSWQAIAALSKDILQNSAQIKGAADQKIVDIVGTGLKFRFRPDLAGLGMNESETEKFVEDVELMVRRDFNNKQEIDHRGKLNVDQIVDIGLRHYLAFGEATLLHTYFDRSTRRSYGLETGSKVLSLPPTRLMQSTEQAINLYQGIRHDVNGRPSAYRFQKSGDLGAFSYQDLPAYGRTGLPIVSHIFDPACSSDVRGVGVFAPAIKRILQSEKLDEVTLQMAVIQTAFAMTLTSELPSAEAFEALEAIEGQEAGSKNGNDLAGEFLQLFSGQMEAAADTKVSSISLNDSPRVSKLAPGEKLDLHNVQVPGSEYLPLKAALSNEIARALGISASSFTLDYSKASYASVRMETAAIHPLSVRTRTRIAAPIKHDIFVNRLDEAIATGRIHFPPGHTVFRRNRRSISNAIYLGPPKLTADDLKTAKAQSERISNGTSCITYETAENGYEFEEVLELRIEEHKKFLKGNLPSPYHNKIDSRLIEGPEKGDQNDK